MKIKDTFIFLTNKIWNSPTATTWMSFLTKSFSVTIIMPLVLNRLKIGDINLWYLFTSVISLQVLLDAGFGSAFVRVIAYGTVGMRDFSTLKGSISEKNTGIFDETFIKTTYDLMTKVYKKLLWISFFTLAIFGSWIFLKPIENSTDPFYGWITWIFFTITFPIILQGNIYINLLQGTHNVPLVRRWDTLFNLLNSLFCIALLLLLPNIYLLIIINQCWLLAATIRNRILAHKRYTFINILPTDNLLENEIQKNVTPNALKSGIGILMSQGIIQASGFIYAQLLTPNALASYLVGLNLIQAIRNFSQAPFYSRLPELSSYSGKGDMLKLRTTAQKNMFRVYLIFSIGFLGVSFLHEPLFKLIGSNAQFPDSLLWNLLGFAYIVDRYGAMHLQLYSTSNHIIWHKLNGITGILMITLSLFLYQYMNVYALPLGMLISYILCYSWYAPYKSYQFINVSFWNFERTTFIPFIVLFIIISFFNLI
ncbi:hypothetical protein ACO2Q8_13955 [Larkinella sp. VNQ87]|uniref:hypothetical protein n=1 Tax=Larkinella sp. VNQ87 TaxID=3400921 RepID=UPI003BFB160B